MKRALLSIAILILGVTANAQQPLRIDHTFTDLEDLSMAWVDSAKKKLHIGYGHTSHGSQLITGMATLESHYSDGRFDFSKSDQEGQLHLYEGNMWSHDGYLGRDVGVVGWDEETREYLTDFPNCNVVIWSWCGEENTILERDVQTHYLDKMEALESEYPDVAFVYMTAPLEGQGPDGALKQANDSIRSFCELHNKILYDYADIEKYDPDDDTNFQDFGGDDGCNYDPDGASPYDRTGNWAEEWVAENASHLITTLSNETNSSDCDFGHTHCLNCVQKGIAAWHLWIRLAGYTDPVTEVDSTTHFVASSGSWHEESNWDNGIPTDTTDVVIDEGTEVIITQQAVCDSLVLRPGAKMVVEQEQTLTARKAFLMSSTNAAETRVQLYGDLLTNESAIVEILIPAGTSTFVMPVSGATVDMFQSADLTVKAWKPNQGSYEQLTAGEPLELLTAYVFENSGDGVVETVEGTLIQGEQSISVDPAEGAAPYNGWYPIGNPFLSMVDWSVPNWNKANVGQGLYRYVPGSNIFTSDINGIQVPYHSGDLLLSPLSAYWIHAHTAGSFGFESGVQTDAETASQKSSQEATEVFYLQVTATDYVKQTSIYFPEGGTAGYDSELDAFYLEGPVPDGSTIYGCYTILDGGERMAINALPSTGDAWAPMGLYVPAEAVYTFSTMDESTYPGTIYLTDLEESVVHDLSTANYQVTIPAGRYNERFVLSNVDTTSSEPEPLPDSTTHFIAQSGAWHQEANWSNGIPEDTTDVFIDEGCSVTISADAVCDSLNVLPGARLTVDAGAVLTCTQAYVQKDVNGVSAQVAIQGAFETTGNCAVDVLLTENNQCFVSPVTGATAKAFVDSGFLVTTWDAQSASYVDVASDEELSLLRAYFIGDLAEPTLVKLQGSLVQGDISIPVSPTEGTGAYAGWYQVGNPYLMPVEWTLTGWERTATGEAFYKYNSQENRFDVYVNGVAVPNGGVSTEFAPMATFWVKAHTEGAFGMSPQVQVTSQTAGNATITEEPQPFYLAVEGTGFQKQLAFYMSDEASDGFDATLDAYFMKGPVYGYQEVYGSYSVNADEEKMAVNALAQTDDLWLDLGISVPVQDEYTFSRMAASSFSEPVYLNDTETGEVLLLDDEAYTIALPAGDYPQRFVLSTTDTSSQQTSVQQLEESLLIYTQRQTLWVESPQPIHADFDFYKLNGEKVLTFTDRVHGEKSYELALSGFYLLKLQTKSGEIYTQKLFFTSP
ncbi:MAG: hypothetical protein ACQESW_10580 [Bacteroidota bacterium]